jgi:hypothetical protein
MKPTGKSEVAVPTSTTFKAAQRAFKARLHVRRLWRRGSFAA